MHLTCLIYLFAQPIAGDKTFTAPLNVTHLDIDGDLRTDVIQDTISLVYILNNTVTTTTNQIVTGDVMFYQDLTVIGDINVDGK